MLSSSPVADHGGNLTAARRRFAQAPEPWIDLSTGINPWPYPVAPLAEEVWQRLPDGRLELALLAAAAAGYGAGRVDQVVAAPGSQALIQLLPRLRSPGRVAVLGPTYAEHAAAWSAAGHQVVEVESPLALAAGPWDVGVLANPNNPDGRRLDPDGLRALAVTLGTRGGWLVVDEAFADLAPEVSLAASVEIPGLIVLRSFGKFFGLAGLRLGFALAAPELAAEIRRALGPWAVSGPALVLGTRALADGAWIADSRKRLDQAAGELDRLLTGHRLEVVGGTALFRLVEAGAAGRADALFESLGRAGILVRRFDRHPGWLRFGLPGDGAATNRLRTALAPHGRPS